MTILYPMTTALAHSLTGFVCVRACMCFLREDSIEQPFLYKVLSVYSLYPFPAVILLNYLTSDFISGNATKVSRWLYRYETL